MRPSEINTVQNIINKINAKQEFTHNLNDAVTGRYIVSIKNIYTGKNPSLKTDLNLIISKYIDNEIKFSESFFYDSIGTWLNDGIYYVDANIHFYDLNFAIEAAKLNNQKAIYDKIKNITINIKY